MTKQEKIQEAWGKYWEPFKNLINEHGFINNKDLGDELFVLHGDFYSYDLGSNLYWSPKSLYGLEKNNGWIKIDGKNSMPKDVGTYWFYNEDYKKIEKKFFVPTNINDQILFKNYTHYQPEEKPNPPIY